MKTDCQGLSCKFFVGTYHTNTGHRVVIVKRGTKQLHAVMQEYPMTVVKISPAEEKFIKHLSSIPLDKACETMLRFGHGWITKGATTLLNEGLAYAAKQTT